MTNSSDGTEYVDVAIIGAGVSGLYSGWRLLTDRSNPALWLDPGRPQLKIYEMGERTGGRLFSVTDLPGLPNVVGELGGMRYMEHQRLVSSLISELGLPSIDFPMGDTSRNLFYLRQHRFTDQDWSNPEVHKPYFLDEQFRNRHPDDLFEMIVDNVLRANGFPKPQDRQGWDAIKPLLRYYQGPDKNYRLEHVGFWNLLMDQIGNEGYELLAQGGGYYSNTINWNSAEALPYIVGDFGGSIEYKTLLGGFDQIARGLEAAYRSAGGEITLQRMLMNFRHNDSNDPDSRPYRYQLIMRDPNNGSMSTVYTNRIILAMPRRSLELLAQDNFLFDSGSNLEVIARVRSVIGEPSFKLLMGFYEEGQTEPWWQRLLGLESGRSITDLPMRQCYYFGTDPETRHSLLLASYNDMSTVDYWKVLEDPNGGLLRFKHSRRFREAFGEERFQPRATPFSSIDELERASERYPQGPRRMVDHALAQLKELHNLPDLPDGRPQIPEPYTTAYMNWNDDPYGGGYHAWKANYDVGETMRFMRRPLPGEDLHICGEAYSDQQGWVEGAFCIAELMLREHFGLATPPWLDPHDYYLGR
ncbi:MAG: hypothetical protein OHK0022_05900 [Roseiflexaceae bacterium]